MPIIPPKLCPNLGLDFEERLATTNMPAGSPQLDKSVHKFAYDRFLTVEDFGVEKLIWALNE
jgi:hypothetical protein